jgi:large subunit ribosomal protein L15
MQFHSLKRVHKNKRSSSVGRGGRRGKTSGRGTKGQNARAGRKKRPELRDIVKKIPKLRGYRFASIQAKPVSVALRTIERHFKAGDVVTPLALIEKGIMTPNQVSSRGVKVIGDAIKIKISLSESKVSKGAKSAIEAAGGSVV